MGTQSQVIDTAKWGGTRMGNNRAPPLNLKIMRYPINNFIWKQSISQLFGVNSKTYREAFSIPGHNGLDIVIRGPKNGYGEPVYATHDGVVGKVSFDDYPLHTRGNGIYLNSVDKTFSTVHWHLSSVEVTVGKNVKEGDRIGLVGNSGFVRPLPTPDAPYNGTHLHFAIIKYNARNDYGGFVDPVPYLFKPGDKLPIYWNRNLWIGTSGDDVSWLQTALRLEGLANDYEPIGLFGPKTLRDVVNLQKKYEIFPQLGFFGEKTKTKLKRYSSYY